MLGNSKDGNGNLVQLVKIAAQHDFEVVKQFTSDLAPPFRHYLSDVFHRSRLGPRTADAVRLLERETFRRFLDPSARQMSQKWTAPPTSAHDYQLVFDELCSTCEDIARHLKNDFDDVCGRIEKWLIRRADRRLGIQACIRQEAPDAVQSTMTELLTEYPLDTILYDWKSAEMREFLCRKLDNKIRDVPRGMQRRARATESVMQGQEKPNGTVKRCETAMLGPKDSDSAASPFNESDLRALPDHRESDPAAKAGQRELVAAIMAAFKPKEQQFLKIFIFDDTKTLASAAATAGIPEGSAQRIWERYCDNLEKIKKAG